MTAQPITKPAAGSQAAAAVAGQAGPSTGDGVRPAHGLRARFGGAGRRERCGYGVWLFVGLVLGVPEIWAGITSPAMAGAVGHHRPS